MKKFSFKSIFATVFAFVVAVTFATQVSAMAPNLSVVSNGNGSMQVSVYADPNASVLLDYYSGGQLLGAGSIGYTNYSGYFSGTINTYNYSMIPSGAQIVVVVNGQQSVASVWPSNGYYNQYPTNGYAGAPTLSQSSLYLTVGQSQAVTVSNNGYYGASQFYIANNLNNVVSATVSGSTINVYATNVGTTTLNVCSNNLVNSISYGLGNYGGSCTTLYVTVTGGYNNYPTYPTYPTYPVYPTYPTYPVYNTPLSVSNSNVQVTVGNTGVVTLYGNNTVYQTYPYTSGTSYYVTSNNSSIASATVNGNTLNIYGMNPGSTTITVCSTTGNQCATVTVTVISPYNVYNGGYNNGNWYWSDYYHCWMQR